MKINMDIYIYITIYIIQQQQPKEIKTIPPPPHLSHQQATETQKERVT